MNISAIEKIVAAGESEHLEFQTSSVNPDSVGAAVCAFLNSGGGAVVVGVEDDGKLQPLANAAAMANAIRERLTAALSPKAMWAVEADAVGTGSVISVEVSAGKDLPYVFNGDIFVRNGVKTVLADAETIRALVQRRYTEPTRWERLPAPGLSAKDLDEGQIRAMVDIAQNTRNYAFKNPADLASVLENLALRQTSGELTNGAEVLFGAMPSRRFPQTRVRVTVFHSDKGGDFRDNRLLEGDLFSLLEKSMALIELHVPVEGRFKTGQLRRQDQPQYPYMALREGLVNALAHRDYAAYNGGVAVGIYPNRIEIWNSGSLPKGLAVQDLKRNHPSLPQNPDLAHVCYLRGEMDRIGRGTQKIAEACQKARLPAPEWQATPAGVTLVFQTRQGKREGKKLNARQRQLLKRLTPGASVKPADYYQETAGSISQRQAQRDLSDLEAGGWLQREGDGPATVYLRTEKA